MVSMWIRMSIFNQSNQVDKFTDEDTELSKETQLNWAAESTRPDIAFDTR